MKRPESAPPPGLRSDIWQRGPSELFQGLGFELTTGEELDTFNSDPALDQKRMVQNIIELMKFDFGEMDMGESLDKLAESYEGKLDVQN